MLLLMGILVYAFSISLERLDAQVKLLPFFSYHSISSPIFDVYKCSDPGLSKVVAPIIKLKDVKDLVQPHTVLVTADEMEDFFTRHVPFRF